VITPEFASNHPHIVALVELHRIEVPSPEFVALLRLYGIDPEAEGLGPEALLMLRRP
jgi:hypothetical protein